MSSVPEPQPTGKHVYVVRGEDEIVAPVSGEVVSGEGTIITAFDDEGQANAWVAAERKVGNPFAGDWRVEKYHIERWTP